MINFVYWWDKFICGRVFASAAQRLRAPLRFREILSIKFALNTYFFQGYHCCQKCFYSNIMPEIDSQVRKFLTSEKPSNTDYSHKCVAKKFHTWMLQCCLETNPEKKLSLSRRQMKAFKEWKYDLPPHQLPELLIHDNIFAHALSFRTKE